MAQEKPIKKILAVKLADLGDALLITPALRALHETYPEAEIEVLTTNGGPVLEGLPYIKRVIYFDKHLFDDPRSALKPRNLLKALRFLLTLTFVRYDTVIVFHHLTLRFGALKFAAVTLATLAARRVGLDNGGGWFFNLKVPDKGFGAVNEREYWLQLVEKLGASRPENTRPQIMLREKDHLKAKNLLDEVRGGDKAVPVVAIHAGGGDYSTARRWLPGGFAQVADTLAEKYGSKIVLLGGVEELELCEKIAAQMQHPALNLAGQTSVREVTAFIEGCDLFIGNDAGLMHLASSVGTPVVAIFGPTNSGAWSPFGTDETKAVAVGSVVVQAEIELPCRPCLYRGMELGSRTGCAPRPCLTEIKPEQVVAVADTFLQFWKPQNMKLNRENNVSYQ